MTVYNTLLSILLVLSALTYARSGKVLFLSKSRNLSYSERAIRTQLFLLSKLMVCSALMIGVSIIHFYNQSNSAYALYLPTLFFLFWFILYKIEPTAFYKMYVEGENCGYDTSMFSDTKCKQRLIRRLLIGIIIAVLSVIITPVYDMRFPNFSKQLALFKLGNYLNGANQTLDIFFFKALLIPNTSFIVAFGLFCALLSLSNIINAVYSTCQFIIRNRFKITKFLVITSCFITIKKISINSIILWFFTVVLESVYCLCKYINYLCIYNIPASKIELPKLWMSSESLTVLISAVCITLMVFMVATIIKLLLLYSYQKNIINCNNLQLALKSQESSHYSKYNFFEKLVDYQTVLVRYIYNPKSLLHKKAAKKSLKDYMDYIDFLGPYKQTIFLGTPLALTGSLNIACACYRAQLKAYAREAPQVAE